ncbi:hypothetical protein BEP19_10835 [Ammoniphilus oxalaticus]|uniref:Uncharacterized protein n=1 Tax=Ammoniphilus oxalaticus TaxID=66863 RepID=A0A419SG26_9BACL|nr:glycosyltransferase [Ammoniphilus oxalaticus]RKD22738.1 hypothetical protein BEP19_10835 [Ammoniphilus oxalaticus]
MRILYFTPYFNQPRGNSTTSKRIVHFLQNYGIHTSVFPYLEKEPWFLPSTETIDVIHILHATRFLSWAQENHFSLERPYIVTMGGTDINVDLQAPLANDVSELLQQAAKITVFTPDAKQKVIRLNSDWANKIHVIPQSAWLPWNIGEPEQFEQPNILLPAGLRPIKDVLHTLPALDDLYESYPNLQFKIVGANLHADVYDEVNKASHTRPWFTYAGVVPFEVMTHWYQEANIVVNSSVSEGQSLAVMEALAIGRPVIARKNAANEELIQHNETGWLYRSMEQFKEAVFSIMNDSFHRGQVIQAGKQWVGAHASPHNEARQYIELYKRAGN